jgi:alpha-L-rhamnosidase
VLRLLLLTLSVSLFAQIDPRLLTARWPAFWITHPEKGGVEFSVVHFRKQVDLQEIPKELLVHVSADNRYRLFVNGKFVVEGPPGDDLRHWRFDTLDLAPYLQRGKNLIAAMVWQGGFYRPMWQQTYRLGFVMQANDKAFDLINSDQSWRTWHNPAFSAIEYEQVDSRFGYRYYVAGPGERFDAAKHRSGWERAEFDDSQWVPVKRLPQASPANVEGHTPYFLTPRSVPFLNSRYRKFAPLALPVNLIAGQKKKQILDLGELSIGHMKMNWQGGKGSKIQLRYAEALQLPDKTKGNRDEVEGKSAIGPWDEVIADGKAHEFQSLTPRSARFVELTVEVGEEPLEITDLHFEELTYPVEWAATFQSDNEDLNRLWRVGQRTLALVAQETFVSDLGWERLQYVGDTMIQALAWMQMSRDDRLVKLALEQFDYSRGPEGITQSRYPANLEQWTPIYALSWMNMVADYAWYRDDLALTGRLLPGMESVVGWFRRQMNQDGLLSGLPGLDFVDHSYSERRKEILAEAPRQSMTVHNLYYIWTLQRAAKVAESLQRPDLASFWMAEANRVKALIQRLTWDTEKKLYSDSPAKKLFSQQVQILAVLSGLVEGAAAQDLLRRTLNDSTLVPVELYFRYYLGRAMKVAGLGDQYLNQLEPWHRMIQQNMSTFGETDRNPRSECHPWSTSPNFELMATVAGIEPASRGFRTVDIAPALGALKSVNIVYPHPRGSIRLKVDADGRGSVDLPAGVTGTFRWKGRAVALNSGLNSLR